MQRVNLSTAVQGVQGTVQGTVQGSKPRASKSVQGVQAFSIRARVYSKKTHSIFYKKIPSRIYIPCTPCTPCTALHTSMFVIFLCLHNCLHTLHNPLFILFFKKIKEKMEYKTGPDNVGFMQTLLKTEFPEFALVVKELYIAGLIDGLRGLTITTECKQASAPLINAPTEKTCDQCQHWRRDQRGDGQGIGACLMQSKRALISWPSQAACAQFSAIV